MPTSVASKRRSRYDYAELVRFCPLLMVDLPVSTFLPFSCTVIVTADVGYPHGFVARHVGLVGGHQAGRRAFFAEAEPLCKCRYAAGMLWSGEAPDIIALENMGALSIPQLAGTVWEACDALKKTATTNCTAVRGTMTQVAFSVKDNLREHKGDPSDDSGDGMFSKADESTSLSDEGGDLTEADTDDDLSAEEMVTPQLIISVVSDTQLS
ncbi:hypothetical protein BHM03_00062873 [Ensete ventricosum]|nr:hypothetical protein BHM03_00062873 [Ensete ventricosum]